MNSTNIKKVVLENGVLILFLLLVLVGLYLRFWNFENSISFGWDQARDAWKTRDLLVGKWVLDGPRTGVGHFHLGPLWFYLLWPFYYLTGWDPIGAIYLNFFVNIFNFVALFWVTRKVFSDNAALFVTFLYAINREVIEVTQTAWNVSPIPGVSALIFYGIYQVVFKEKYKYIPIVAFLTGLFSHLHFSVVFLPPIIILSFLFARYKKKVFLTGLVSLPLFLIWFIPNVISEVYTNTGDVNLLQNFTKDYYVGGFYGKFFLFRLNDAFIQFHTTIFWPLTNKLLKFILPIIFAIVVLFEKDRRKKILGILISFWFIVPSVLYTLYGGSTSEYYVLLNWIMVVYILYYLQEKLLKTKWRKTLLLCLVIAWSLFTYHQTKDLWVKPEYGGLAKQKDTAKQATKDQRKIEYNEGVIESYLYHIWNLDKRPIK